MVLVILDIKFTVILEEWGLLLVALAIDEAKKIIPDDEVYMSTRLDNIASLKVQLHNNAYIHHTDNEHYYTRIRIK